MDREESCILTNLGRYFPLGEADKKALLALEKSPYDASEKELLWSANARIHNLYTLKSGWACTYRDNLDGVRQIVDVLIPGDIVGLRDLTFAKHMAEARMITKGTVCPFPLQNILDIINTSTPLAVALIAAIARQESILTERMLITVNRSARSRIAHFFVEMYSRLNRVKETDIRRFYLPISQQMLGEILGVSTVHVNRSLMALERENIVKKHRYYVEVMDTDRLFQEAEFNSDYLGDEMCDLRERLMMQAG
ncbi:MULTISPECIES: Crp/Fnr family transcriptional regulator [Halomonadaceae]|uniref:Crp/Fnr family transcriptional regulator n=1 Tax=Halomonadaceae TaxID=28256 RepID=UPI001599DBD2|nr:MULTISPECIES: Crp/Fnr family transcriptional regulator [Halomonas]QJQ94673.1 Crp/Fnr family transcriptional regulator [Halomonas sp. PA5]